ncbi:MAG: DM13 domain-containing protein [Anaerolineales bacterium]
MTRHIRWNLVFGMAILVVIAAASPLWLAQLAPEQTITEDDEAFACPPEIGAPECTVLAEIEAENPLEAEAMIAALLADPIPAPANEASRDSMASDIDRDAVSVFSETRVRTGIFTRIDPLHFAEGTVNVWEIVADEQVIRYVRFEDGFRVARGPDLRVYFSINPEPRTAEEMLAGDSALEIGLLKGNLGGQNYRIDNDIDIPQFASVVIFSAQYGTVFSSAPLQQPLQ